MMTPAAYYVCLFVHVLLFFLFFFLVVAGVVVVHEDGIALVEFPATIRVQQIAQGNLSLSSALIKRGGC